MAVSAAALAAAANHLWEGAASRAVVHGAGTRACLPPPRRRHHVASMRKSVRAALTRHQGVITCRAWVPGHAERSDPDSTRVVVALRAWDLPERMPRRLRPRWRSAVRGWLQTPASTDDRGRLPSISE